MTHVTGRRALLQSAAVGYGPAFWLIAFVFATGTAFSTVPTPLYPLYQALDGFSTFTITIVFAAYVVGVLISLMLAGQLSDVIGRKRVLVAALILELAGAATAPSHAPTSRSTRTATSTSVLRVSS